MVPEEEMARFLDVLFDALLDRQWSAEAATKIAVAVAPDVTKHYLNGK